MSERRLIVNADDFGLSPLTNQGIVAAHERGIVTSASLMVRWPAAIEAVEYWRTHPSLDLGLHIDLAEWAFRQGQWVRLYEVVPMTNTGHVRAEIERQFQRFRELTGRDPTHVDSHQHVHRNEPVLSVATDLSRQLGIPLRHIESPARYCGDFYGQDAEGNSYPSLISTSALIEILERLPAGVTELCCHPGFDDVLDSMYVTERHNEVSTLCDDRVKETLRRVGIELISFRELRRSGS
jgi:predicted glycoside hydrolase/deacetylase ChbG (UPF0249 family)